MKLLLSSLPSKGLGYPKNMDHIDIEELTYLQITKYSRNKVERGSIQGIIHDIDNLISDIPGWRDMSCYDESSIVFIRKYISATYDEYIKVPIDGEEYKLKISDITFKDINDKLRNTKSLILSGKVYKFHVATIGEYYNVLMQYQSSDYSDAGLTPGILMLTASLGGWSIIDTLLNSKKDDALIVKEYSDLLEDQYNDVTVKLDSDEELGGDAVIKINYLITDIFRLLRINSKDYEKQIITK